MVAITTSKKNFSTLIDLQLQANKNLESIKKIMEFDRVIQLANLYETKQIDADGDRLEDIQKKALEKSEIRNKQQEELNANIKRIKETLYEIRNRITKKAETKTTPEDLSEKELDQMKRDEKTSKLLEQIEENTKKEKEVKKRSEEPKSQLGLLASSIAVALGSLLGVLLAQVKIIKATFKALNFGKLFEPLVAKIKTIPTFFNTALELFKKNITAGLTKLSGALPDSIKNIGQTLTKFFKPISDFMGEIKKYSTPIGKVISRITSTVKSISGIFSNIMSKFSIFGKILGTVAKTVSKIATPLLIIKGLFDGVVEAIEGYKEGGILGGVKGFIVGLINSVFMSFFDLIKDGISWVLGKLGFEDAEKFLDSFSFQDLFKEFVDLIYKPFEWLADGIGKLKDLLVGIEIPKFGMDLGKFGDWTFGPYKPFSGLASDNKLEAKPTTPPIQQLETKPIPNKTADIVYEKSSELTNISNNPVSAPTTVIAAPSTNVKQTKNYMMNIPVRNQDSSINSFYKSRLMA